MKKSRWVYQEGRVVSVSFVQGWRLGLAAARSLWRPIGSALPLVGLYFFFALFVVAFPVIGFLMGLFLTVPVAVAAMRMEQIEMGRGHSGVGPRLVDACSLVFKKRFLLKMIGLSALSLLSYALFTAVFPVLISALVSTIHFAPSFNLFIAENLLEKSLRLILITASVLVSLWSMPVIGGLWSMVGWSIAIQGESDVPVFARAFELAKKTGTALIAVYLPPAIFGAVVGVPSFMLAAETYKNSSDFFFLGLAGCLSAFLGYLALMIISQARGVHCICRLAMMRIEAVQELDPSPDTSKSDSALALASDSEDALK